MREIPSLCSIDEDLLRWSAGGCCGEHLTASIEVAADGPPGELQAAG